MCSKIGNSKENCPITVCLSSSRVNTTRSRTREMGWSSICLARTTRPSLDGSTTPEGTNRYAAFPTPIGGIPYSRGALQWILERQDDGQLTIRTVSNQKYLGFESSPRDGTAVVGLDRPRLWDIEILSDSEYHDNTRVKYVFF